jgi:hypothetical protein
MRDMVVHGDDLVVATYGRALWVLDDVAPLRQIGSENTEAAIHLFKPPTAIRARWDVNGDTPLPIETPTAPNPPEGAIIDYSLNAIPAGDVTLKILDARGRIVRTFTSSVPPEPQLLANVPSYWFAPPAVLTKDHGLNRFAWNLRYPNPKLLPFGYFGGLLPYVEYTLAEHAIPGETPRDQPEGPLALPGDYTIEISAGGNSERQMLTVHPDPRVRATDADLTAQFELATRLTDALAITYDAFNSLNSLRSAIAERLKAAAAAPRRGDETHALDALEKKVDAIQNGTASAPGMGLLNRDLARLYQMVMSADARPAERLQTWAVESCQALATALDRWRELNSTDLPAVNRALARAALPSSVVGSVPAAPRCGP